ncbi:hypothetical protein JJC03_09350 [Flavobacterium oreochromis]|uniref:hypothetical protein n=1 Tax=Flavobacterium oreochromis TaxID=2906078 RepID=UPI001CE64D15|nr:hypothetical protein [Flavobacterium oreochromis]QYS85443.1 hypothetical protein JJC03_09350 [Flavobacterium oreochromis]
MIYNSEKKIDTQRALVKIRQLISQRKTFELTEKRPKRTLSQNNYLHLILSWYALEYGETLAYIKQEVFKKQINQDLFHTEFINRKTGEIRDSWRSSADLSTAELTQAIERFRNYSAKEAGIYLPEPSDLAYIKEIEIQIENNKLYL